MTEFNSPDMSRRKMLTTMGLLAGASLVNPGSVFSSSPKAKTAQTSDKINDPFSLKGKSAIVTGAARGIGRAIAVALATAGADIMGIDIAGPASPEIIYPAATQDDLKETGSLVEEQKRRFISVAADIRNLDSLKQAADRAVKEFGKIDILVADAGIQVYGPVAKMTDPQWNDVIDVNLTGTVNSVRAVINHMIDQNKGRIIMVASGQGRHGFKEGSAYAASKWGIIGFMKSLALEVAENNITVNTIEPGLVDTFMTRNSGRWNAALKQAGKQPEGDHPKEADVIAARMIVAVQKIPWMQPEDVAPVAVFLSSDAAYRVTGATYDATAGDSANYTA
jgi:NAD(P)-dependent dehydrogenase (short-subunit alcohol dehydrogenase family)